MNSILLLIIIILGITNIATISLMIHIGKAIRKDIADYNVMIIEKLNKLK